MDDAQRPKFSVYDASFCFFVIFVHALHVHIFRVFVVWRDVQEIGLINPTKGSGDNIAITNPLSSSHSKQEKCKKITRPPNDKDEASLNCPRCNSTNTKFCYYNNYNPSQPRHLCKACRRYWTHGGTLRNVPVGGSSRARKKNKSSFVAPSQLNNTTLSLNLNPTPTTCLPSNFSAQDLNMGLYYANAHHFLPIPSPFELSASHGALIPYHVSMFSSQPYSDVSTRLFQFQDNIKPTLDLCMDGGFESTTHERSNMELGAGRITYPFGDQLKQVSTTSSAENISDQANGQVRDSGNGVLYWNNNHGLYN
ncbi:hypothetical protein QQ045_015139 [Rhodiola kirilowii]